MVKMCARHNDDASMVLGRGARRLKGTARGGWLFSEDLNGEINSMHLCGWVSIRSCLGMMFL